ncbi:MAG: ISAs1 family transposase [Opitutaceae bacterium]
MESFVDGQLFRGACYKAQGWSLLGATRGHGRHAEDYYVEHQRPKQLWVRELASGARETLCAPVLPPALQAVEAQVLPRPGVKVAALHTLVDYCREVPDWRGAKGRDYPLPGLLTMIVLATLCQVVRGQRDLAAFASGLTQAQLRALLCRKGRDGRCQYPKETTFQRILAQVPADTFSQVLHQWAGTCLGPCDQLADTLVAIDGKALRGSTPHCPDEQKAQLAGAVSLPSGRSLGVALVEEKSNEIPAARELLTQLGPLDGKLVMLDALHTSQATLRAIHQDHGADYLVPVKDNHPTLHAAAQACLPAPPPPCALSPERPAPPPPARAGGFPPSAPDLAPAAVRYYRRKRRNQSRAAGETHPALGRHHA